MQRVVSGSGQVAVLKQHYDRVLTDVSSERDQLQKERTELLQVRSATGSPRCHEALVRDHATVLQVGPALNGHTAMGVPCNEKCSVRLVLFLSSSEQPQKVLGRLLHVCKQAQVGLHALDSIRRQRLDALSCCHLHHTQALPPHCCAALQILPCCC